MLLLKARVYPKGNSHSRLLTSLIPQRARRPPLSSDLRHGRLMDHAHPRKRHNRYNVYDDEFSRILYHNHKSIASTRQQQASWKYDARIFRYQFQPCQPFAAAESIAEGVDIVLVSQAYNKPGKRPEILYLPSQFKWIYGSTYLRTQRGEVLGAHTDQVELWTHISTKQFLDAINLKVSGMCCLLPK